MESRPGGRLAQPRPRVPPMASSSSRDSDRENCAAAFHVRKLGENVSTPCASCAAEVLDRRQLVVQRTHHLGTPGSEEAGSACACGRDSRRRAAQRKSPCHGGRYSARWRGQTPWHASPPPCARKTRRITERLHHLVAAGPVVGQPPRRKKEGGKVRKRSRRRTHQQSRVVRDQATAAPASSHRSRHLKAPARPLPPEGRNMAQPRQTAKPEIVVHQRSGRSSGFANLGQTLPELRRESDAMCLRTDIPAP